jgi:hypothetical protein
VCVWRGCLDERGKRGVCVCVCVCVCVRGCVCLDEANVAEVLEAEEVLLAAQPVQETPAEGQRPEVLVNHPQQLLRLGHAYCNNAWIQRYRSPLTCLCAKPALWEWAR